MSQKQRILDHYKQYKTLDRLRAFTRLGIFELAARITDLEKDGYKFKKVRRTAKNQFNEPYQHTIYKLLPN